MKKRILSTLLAVCMMLALLPGTALAVTVGSGQCGNNATWSLDSNGTLTIKGTGAMKNYSGTSEPWKNRRGDITKIVIQKGITYIGGDAFYNCVNLSSVVIPDGVVTIGSRAFYGCQNLPSITIPDSISTIEANAFQGCSRLRDIYYSGTEAKWNTISIHKSNYDRIYSAVSRIRYSGSPNTSSILSGQCGNNATWSLDSSGTLTIGGTGAMTNYSGTSEPWKNRRGDVKKIIVKQGITSIGGDAFYNCVNAVSAVLPAGVVTIGSRAFYGCQNMTSISLPASIGTIESNAFQGCSRLKTVYFSGTESQWNSINIHSSNNSSLYSTDSRIVYNYQAPSTPTTKYTIRFNANGGTVSKASITVAKNAKYGTLPTPTRSGYKFDGWYTAKTGGTKVSSSTTATASRTLYAHWTKNASSSTAPKMYLITFNPNGGTVFQNYAAVVNGGIYRSLPTPVYPGRHFKGWYTAKTGGTKVTPKTKVSLTGNRTLYAQWTTSSVSVRSLQTGSWQVTVPAGYKLALYANETTASQSSAQTPSQNKTLTCTRMAELSNGTVRYYAQFSGRSYWFCYSDEMTVN